MQLIETLTLSQVHMAYLRIIERRKLRNIIGQEKGQCRIGYTSNNELYKVQKSLNIIIIKVSRLRLVGHVKQTDEKELIRRLCNVNRKK